MFERVFHIQIQSVTQEEYLELIFFILEASKQYYEFSKSLISDEEFDRLFLLLIDIEQVHPERIVENSPTQNLFHQATKIDSFQKANHKVPLLSLENTYNAEDIYERNDTIVSKLEKMQTLTTI